jgi:MarR family transcriptional regulator, 2-MHQ and catechol-resistance regulon repressor
MIPAIKKKSTEELYGSTGELNLKLIVTLTRCVTAIQRKEVQIWQEAGLTPAQFGILEVIYHKGPMPICELIRKTLSSGGNMTVVIDNLEKQNLVERTPDVRDRRSYIISLTSKGESKINKIFPAHVDNLKEILSGLSREEKKQMIELAKKLGKSV